MADANGINLDQFAHVKFSQAGTPVLDAQGRLKDGAFELTIKQTIPATPDMADKQPMMIPVKTVLLNEKAKRLSLNIKVNG